MSNVIVPSVLTIQELATYLKISKSTLYKLVQEGNVPAKKIGRHWRFHRQAIDRWLLKSSNKCHSKDVGGFQA